MIVFFLWKGAQEVLFHAKCCGPWFPFCRLLNSTSRPAVQAKQLAFQGSACILQYYYKEKKEKLLWHCHSCCRMKASLSNSGVCLSRGASAPVIQLSQDCADPLLVSQFPAVAWALLLPAPLCCGSIFPPSTLNWVSLESSSWLKHSAFKERQQSSTKQVK